ncbi:hypothetical protein K3426_001664 [Neisseria gonorrhoeae]
MVFTRRLRCGREEKRREEKRREEKRREEKRREEKRREEKFFGAGFIFGSLYRFDRLKKKIFTDVEGRIISGSGRCFNTIWRMNKNRYGVAPPRPKGNGSLRRPSTGRIGSVPFVPSAARRLVLIFVNPLYV